MSLRSLCGEPLLLDEEMFKFHGSLGDCPKPPLPRKSTLEDLLRMTVPIGPGFMLPEGTPMSPEFRVAVQCMEEEGVRIIIHALGHDSETLTLLVSGDKITH